MPKPWKDLELQNKMRDWVEKNPDRWYTAKYEDIHVETGVSVSTLYRSVNRCGICADPAVGSQGETRGTRGHYALPIRTFC